MASVALGESDRTRAKRITAADAAAKVDSGDWVEYGTGIGQPDAFDAALGERGTRRREHPCVPVGAAAPVLEADPGP